MTKWRAAVLIALAVSLWVGFFRPAPVSADNVGGQSSSGCVRSHTAYFGNVSGYSRWRISFRLDIENIAGVVGRWEYNGAPAGANSSWLNPDADTTKSWFVTPNNTPASHLVINEGQTGNAAFVLRLASASYPGCFRVSNVVVERIWAAEPLPTVPPSTAYPHQTFVPGDPSDTPPPAASGHCWVQLDNGIWHEFPCIGNEPPASPPPWGGDCPPILTGYGTYAVNFGPTSEVVGCVIWAGYYPTSAASPPVFSFTIPSSWLGWYQGSPGSTGLRIIQSAELPGTSWAEVPHMAAGSSLSGACGQSTTSSEAGPTWRSGPSNTSSCTSYTMASKGRWVRIVVAHNTLAGEINRQTGFQGTITITGPEGLNTPNGETWMDYYCDGDPEHELCDFDDSPPLPPDWATPDPGAQPPIPWSGFDICSPEFTASTRSACATWPPTAPPGGGSTSQVCDPGSPSADALLCASYGGGDGPVGPDYHEDRLGDLRGQLGEKVPMGWVDQLNGYLESSSASAAGGPSGDWCFSFMSAQACIDPSIVSGPAEFLRPIMVGLLYFLFAFGALRRSVNAVKPVEGPASSHHPGSGGA